MSGLTDNYQLVKPVVGGSENEWGGNLNADLDKIDALLGGDEPINGIDIESGTIDGGAITGEIGKTPEDGEDPVSIHPDVILNGKIDELVGLEPGGDPAGAGVIRNVEIFARDLEVEGRVVEGNASPTSGTSADFSPDFGSIAVANISEDQSYEYNLLMPKAGMSLTLVINKSTDTATNIVWSHDSQPNSVKWVGGKTPALDLGINIIQFFTVDMGAGAVCFGAFTGIAS